jgi:hypothetical protein
LQKQPDRAARLDTVLEPGNGRLIDSETLRQLLLVPAATLA